MHVNSNKVAHVTENSHKLPKFLPITEPDRVHTIFKLWTSWQKLVLIRIIIEHSFRVIIILFFLNYLYCDEKNSTFNHFFTIYYFYDLGCLTFIHIPIHGYRKLLPHIRILSQSKNRSYLHKYYFFIKKR